MRLYFGNFVTTVSTLMVIIVIAYIAYSAVNHKQIQNWGRRVALLAVLGLMLCCLVATRDYYYKSVQAYLMQQITTGLFAFDSIQSILCCIGGAVIAFSSVSCIFVRNRKYRKAIFFVLGVAIILKTLIIEFSRVLMG